MHSDNKCKVEIFIEPDGDGFHAYCPALKGLHTCGDTEEEALENAKDATIEGITQRYWMVGE